MFLLLCVSKCVHVGSVTSVMVKIKCCGSGEVAVGSGHKTMEGHEGSQVLGRELLCGR